MKGKITADTTETESMIRKYFEKKKENIFKNYMSTNWTT